VNVEGSKTVSLGGDQVTGEGSYFWTSAISP
jgi:hypothetical protein